MIIQFWNEDVAEQDWLISFLSLDLAVKHVVLSILMYWTTMTDIPDNCWM